ncbi:ABC transporter ATP-binding protein [Paenibacillus sp. MBLB4367]|uniref:ABC transporter ATP-binding protein n=1 Tax=Paenibacillus sp. MBLB4367 TaxID=3384767 RepID=UPI00390837D3
MTMFTRLARFALPYKRWFVYAALAMIAGIAFDLIAPWLLKQTIDVGISNSNVRAIVLYAGLLGIGQIFKSGIMYLQNYSQERLGQDVIFDLRQSLYAHLQRLSFGYYDKAQTGQIMSRMTGDIEAVKNFIGFGGMLMATGAVSFVGTVIVMLNIHWKTTLISMITIPPLLIALRQFNRKVGPAWGAIREQMGKLTTTLQENISGIRVVKAFSQEKLEQRKFNDRNETNFDSNMSRAKIEAHSFPLLGFYGGIIFLLMLWVGGYYVAKGEMTVGELMAFQWYIWGIVWPLNMLGWLVNIMQQAFKAAPRVFEILDTEVDIDTRPNGSISAQSIQGYVRFNHVSFRFPNSAENAPMVLSDISFEARPGEAVALLGATGSGKSSITHLLSRFYDVTEGEVLIDGRDVKDYDLMELRRKVGIVPQETFLFSATIRDNIAYGRPEATQEQIEWASRKAQIHDFIDTQPNGYDTLIGERGVGLSGGQRQRVALARAILLDPPILVLDEATASVDTATESAIHEALHEVMQGRTTFIVAQRLSSIQRADRILVLEDGSIAQEGTHQELYESDGFFRKLFNLQDKSGSGHSEQDGVLAKAEGR